MLGIALKIYVRYHRRTMVTTRKVKEEEMIISMIMKSDILLMCDNWGGKDAFMNFIIKTTIFPPLSARLFAFARYEICLVKMVRAMSIERGLLFSSVIGINDLLYKIMTLIYQSIEIMPIPSYQERRLRLLYGQLRKKGYSKEKEQELVATHIRNNTTGERCLIMDNGDFLVDTILLEDLLYGGIDGPMGYMTEEQRHAYLIDYSSKNIKQYEYSNNHLAIIRIFSMKE